MSMGWGARTCGWLLVDVDGVLAPFVWQDGFREVFVEGRGSFGVNVQAGQAVGALAEELGWRLMFATAWGHDAVKYLCPVLGWSPRTKFLRVPANGAPGGVKTDLIRKWSKRHEQPVAWFDDEHTPEGREWALDRLETLLVDVDPRTGLQPEQIDQVRDWAVAACGTG